MNAVVKYLTFIQTLIKYLKGGMFVYEGQFDKAIKKLKPCLDHPSFQNELLYSYYGQALCGQGKLDEGHKYLIKACKEFEKIGWCFGTEYKHNLANNTLNALKHVLNHTSIIEGKEFLDKVIKVKK